MEMFSLGTSADLDRKAPSALHRQISDAIRSRIVTGEWAPGHRVKSEPDLSAELGVSRGTLRRALSTLIEEGLLKQTAGRGTFVNETMLEPAVAQKLSTLSEDFASQGVILETEVISSGLVSPPGHIGSLLRVQNDARVLRLVRIRSAKSGAVALLHNYVRVDRTPEIEKVNFVDSSLFGILEGKYMLDIASARRSFSAQPATPEVAKALGVPNENPVQYLEQLTFLTNGDPIEYSDVWINSSRMRVTTLMARR